VRFTLSVSLGARDFFPGVPRSRIRSVCWLRSASFSHSRVRAHFSILLVAGLSFFAVYKTVRWLRFIREFRLARITPDQLRDQLSAGEDVLILDVQRTEKHLQELVSIPGAIRIDPRDIEWDRGAMREVEKSTNREVVIYCTCPSEFTSARVALVLRRRGLQHVRPLAGGLQAWRDRGFAVTTEVRLRPGPTSPC
jgi:rhodanese-related sulfurtransferase